MNLESRCTLQRFHLRHEETTLGEPLSDVRCPPLSSEFAKEEPTGTSCVAHPIQCRSLAISYVGGSASSSATAAAVIREFRARVRRQHRQREPGPAPDGSTTDSSSAGCTRCPRARANSAQRLPLLCPESIQLINSADGARIAILLR